MRSFAGKVAVITGGGSGVGRALALALAEQGARLALSDVNAAGLDETAAQCGSKSEVRTYRLDVSDREAMHAHAEEVAAAFGTVDLVFNNAGIALAAEVSESSWRDLDRIVGVNLWGVLHGSKAFLPHLIASGDGHLVNISSVFGLVGVPTQSAYAATKFAVRGFTEVLDQEMRLAGHPVSVSCVHPGGVRTGIARNARVAGDRSPSRFAHGFERIARTSPQRAAHTILRGIRRGRSRILVGPDAYAIEVFSRILGGRYQQLLVAVARAGSNRSSRGR